MKQSTRLLAVILTLGVSARTANAVETSQKFSKPNIVYIMADDIGWSDIGVHGGSIPTPNIDRLFRQGVELRNFMGWPLCSPTRAMLLTGRHPFRVGSGPRGGGELAGEETTIAEAFQANGYRTGVFGKWHNGRDPDTAEFRQAWEEAFPNRDFRSGLGANEHGFEQAWVYYGGGADHFTRRIVKGTGPVSWWHNRDYRPEDKGYTDDLVTRQAIRFIRSNNDRPFFCYVPFHIVHTPLQAKAADLKLVDPTVTDETLRTYAAMVQAMDANVGAILAELQEQRLRHKTIVVFTSDNGATAKGNNLPLRSGKNSIYEGGVRLPTVVHWPNGEVVGYRWEGLCGALDMFPTLLAMADCEMPETRPLDGKNIWPALKRLGKSPVENYYWSLYEQDAIRTERWKLHRYFDRCELYDIRKDEGETANVADAHPSVVKSLTAMMDAWAESLSAALSHQPLPAYLDADPAPAGGVLQVTVTVTDKAGPNDILVVPIAVGTGWPSLVQATDWVEFDIAVADNSLRHGYFYSPILQGQVAFRRGVGVDQFSREQVLGPEPIGGPGVWEHRIIGLCSFAPRPLRKHVLVFRGGTPGTYKVWLDNLRIRSPDGSATRIWASSQDTVSPVIEDSEFFRNVRVRAVQISNSADPDN